MTLLRTQRHIYLFADDTSLVEYISNPITSFEKVIADLHRLHIWSKLWLVIFNPTKTAYVVLSKNCIAKLILIYIWEM